MVQSKVKKKTKNCSKQRLNGWDIWAWLIGTDPEDFWDINPNHPKVQKAMNPKVCGSLPSHSEPILLKSDYIVAATMVRAPELMGFVATQVMWHQTHPCAVSDVSMPIYPPPPFCAAVAHFGHFFICFSQNTKKSTILCITRADVYIISLHGVALWATYLPWDCGEHVAGFQVPQTSLTHQKMARQMFIDPTKSSIFYPARLCTCCIQCQRGCIYDAVRPTFGRQAASVFIINPEPKGGRPEYKYTHECTLEKVKINQLHILDTFLYVFLKTPKKVLFCALRELMCI